MTAPAEREFEISLSGEVRDLILENFRSGLRAQINPETGQLFTPDEIAAATGQDSRWYREAQAVDDLMQGDQRKALFLKDQLQIDRASTAWLENYHGPMWTPEGRLPASSGSGMVTVTGVPETVIVGSTSVPDETAYWGRAAGVRVQVFASSKIEDDGSATVLMVAMDGGSLTNLKAGTIIEWSSRDPSMSPQATVLEDWTGGTNAETDADWATRMIGNVRHRPGGGNDAMQRALARAASNAVEDAFVYATAFGNGSFLVVPLQKRGSSDTSPTARAPSPLTLSAVTGRVVPPGAPDNPSPPRGLVLPPVFQTSNIDLKVSLRKGSTAGFIDVVPWPANPAADISVATRPTITFLVGNTCTLNCPEYQNFPGQDYGVTLTGDSCPKMMFWHAQTSSWRPLSGIQTIAQVDLGDFNITFSQVPPGLANGCIVSPAVATGVANLIAATIRRYFDSRGPGEVIDVETHERGARCVRFPERDEEYPSVVGADLPVRIIDALPGAASDARLVYCSRFAPDIPADPILGPRQLIVGTVGIYPL